jgi:hypothetical protein
MPLEKVSGLQSGVFGNASVITSPAGWIVLGDISITERITVSRTQAHGKVKRRVTRDTGLDCSFTVLIDTTKAPMKKVGETVVVASQRYGSINFEVAQVDEVRKDGADGVYNYKLTADEGIEYTSA